MLLRRPPRGFKGAMAVIVGFVGYLVMTGWEDGSFNQEKVEELRQLVFFWE